MSVITVNNLSVMYEKECVFSDISFSVEKGDYIALAGPNGSGKSTLIKTILSLVKPIHGSVFLFDKPLGDFKDWDKIGYVPQKLNLSQYFPATVKEVVAMGLVSKQSYFSKIKKVDLERIDYLLNLMEIQQLKDKNINELSGGQLQRAIIARALVSNPELLILDEPTTALDPNTRERFFITLKDLNMSDNVTIILITHDTGGAGQYAKKLMYFDSKIVFYGTFDDFCSSESMSSYFGYNSQHIICHKH